MTATIAERLFDAFFAECELETLMEEHGVPFEKLGWDCYDGSIEIHGVPSDYRLPQEVCDALKAAGFAIAFVNHVDKWETHYNLKENSQGWRVSYPHKRNDGNAAILVEKPCEAWPKEWFETGRAVVVKVAAIAMLVVCGCRSIIMDRERMNANDDTTLVGQPIEQVILPQCPGCLSYEVTTTKGVNDVEKRICNYCNARWSAVPRRMLGGVPVAERLPERVGRSDEDDRAEGRRRGNP